MHRLMFVDDGRNVLAALRYHEVMQENRLLANRVREQHQELLKRQQVLQSYKNLHPDLFAVELTSNGSIILDDDANQKELSY